MHSRIQHLSFQFFLLSALIAFHCSTFIQQPTLERIQSIAIMEFSNDRFVLRFVIDLYNPNPFGARLDSMTYRVYLQKVFVGSGQLQEGTDVPGDSVVTLILPLEVERTNTGKLTAMILNVDTLTYNVVGNYTISILGQPIDRPLDLNGNVPLRQKIMEHLGKEMKNDTLIALAGIGFSDFSLKRTTFSIRLRVKNPLGVDFTIKRCNFDVAFDEKNIGNGNLDVPTLIPAKSKEELEFSISANNFKLLSTAASMIFGSKPRYHLTGAITIEVYHNSIEVPLDFQGQVQ
jgi:LEA14-like dessication related protein